MTEEDRVRERVAALEAIDGQRAQQIDRLDRHITSLAESNSELAKQVGILATQVGSLSRLPDAVAANTTAEAVGAAVTAEEHRASKVVREHIGLIVTISVGLSGVMAAVVNFFFGG